LRTFIDYSVLQTHVARHAVDVTVNVKNAAKAPVIIAPATLVATKVIVRSTSDVKIVPMSAVKTNGNSEPIHTQRKNTVINGDANR